MKILITGGAGFLGKKLVLALLEQGEMALDGEAPSSITRITVHDRAHRVSFPDDPRLELLSGDIADPREAGLLMNERPDLIYHMAAVVSGEAEQNFDAGMGVNMLGTLFFLEAMRRAGHRPRVVFASSVAVYGSLMPETIKDDTLALPLSSYGTQKATGELLINDYSRKGFIDGRAIRLPTVVVREGGPNLATSTFASTIIREPLQGRQAVCPVSLDTRLWILSPQQAVSNLIHAGELSADQFGDPRILMLPGLSVSVGEMIGTLTDVAGPAAANLIDHRPDEMIQRIVGSWPTSFEPTRALAAGFTADESMRAIVDAFMQNDMN